MRAATVVFCAPALAAAATVLPEVDEELARRGKVDLWVQFDGDYTPLSAANASTLTRGERRQHVYDESRRAAEHSQRAVWEMLRRRGVRYESHWISNTLYVEGAGRDTAHAIAGLKSVASVGRNVVIGHTEPHGPDAPRREDASILSTTRCAEWAICPTDINNNNPDCSRGVDIVTNSWGGVGSNTNFLAPVQRWREAGIVVVFSGGNFGSNCGSVNSPAGLNLVMATGASDEQMRQASFGSRGPGPSNNANIGPQHPDVTAPGVNVWGAGTQNTAYRTMSGTSMAAPQLAGLAALLLSVNPSLGHDDIIRIVQSTAQRSGVVGQPQPASAAQTCGSKRWDDFSDGLNYHYGGGIIDANAAVRAAAALPGAVARRANATRLSAAARANLRWNVLVTKADLAWEVTQGDGVVVADIDTGVIHTHESLIANYRGNNGDGSFTHDYNWASFNGREPYDSNGHGTHTTSSVLGSVESGVGIAPSAKWVGCKAL